MVALFSIFRFGASGWAKVESRSDLLSQARIVSSRLSELGQKSSRSGSSVSVDGSFLSFPLSSTAEALPRRDSISKEILWNGFALVWHDKTKHTLEWQHIDTPEPHRPSPLDTLDLEDGPKPLQFYAQKGQSIATHVSGFSAKLESGLILLSLTFEKERYGRTDPEVLPFELTIRPRN